MKKRSNPPLGEKPCWTSETDINWYKWRKKPSWRIGEACLLLLGFNPDVSSEEEQARDNNNFRAFRPFRMFRELSEVAVSALEAGILKPLPYDIGGCGKLATRVSPCSFLVWARSEDFPISFPPELQELLEHPGHAEEPEEPALAGEGDEISAECKPVVLVPPALFDGKTAQKARDALRDAGISESVIAYVLVEFMDQNTTEVGRLLKGKMKDGLAPSDSTAYRHAVALLRFALAYKINRE